MARLELGHLSFESLDLQGCVGISDAGVRQLVKIDGLKRLSLGGCPGVSSSVVEELQQAMPEVRVKKDDEMWAYRNRDL